MSRSDVILSLEIKISTFLTKELKLDKDTNEIITYSLHLVFSTIIGIAFIVFAGWVLDVVQSTLFIAVSAAIVRSFSGGAHCSSPFRCALTGAIIFPSLALLVEIVEPILSDTWIITIIVLSLFFSGISFYLWAPADSPGKPITTIMHRTKLRRLTFASVVLLVVIALAIGKLKLFSSPRAVILSLMLGLAWQGFSVSPAGYKFTHGLDFILRLGRKI
jgi:accessory gene regulator B